jgi:antitoxin PrlF
MKEIPSTVTSKGQVTIPVEVRRFLGLKHGDKLTFILDGEGRVELKVPKYPSIASLAGAAGRLSRSLPMDEMLDIAREEAVRDEHQKDR